VKTTRKRTSRKTVRPSGAGWELLVVDGTPIRKKARRDYQKAVRDLAAARLESERFQQEDKPAFSRWMAKKFGALLAEIREFQGRLAELQQLVAEVEEELEFGPHSTASSAYREVKTRRETAEQDELEAEEAEPKEPNGSHEASENNFNKAAEDFFEQAARERENAAREKKLARQSGRLKELYRALARRLHPDKGLKLTPREKEWWHQTQAAYETGDIEQLEMILTLLEVEDKGAKQATISTLHQLTAAFKKSLRALKRQLAEFRRDIAWNFSRRQDHDLLARQMRFTLEADRRKLQWVLQRYEEQIQLWERPARRPRPAPSAKRVRTAPANWVDEEWF
jgi:hypothetical protein